MTSLGAPSGSMAMLTGSLNDSLRDAVVLLYALAGALALFFLVLGVVAAAIAVRRPSAGAGWLAAGCGAFLTLPGLAALGMATALLGEDEPLWVIGFWGAGALALLGVALADVVVGLRAVRQSKPA